MINQISQEKLARNKSVLARFLATENITVSHVAQPSAAFDTLNRVLYLPIWDDITPVLYDLMVGHEVGHALETPTNSFEDQAVAIAEQVIAALPKTQNLNKRDLIGVSAQYLNVVEDVRIERLIQQRYPGLKRRFIKGYQELWKRKFFGTDNRNDIKKMRFIDKINVYFKMGQVFSSLIFPKDQAKIIAQIAAVDTYDDAVKATIALLTYSLENSLQVRRESFDRSILDKLMAVLSKKAKEEGGKDKVKEILEELNVGKEDAEDFADNEETMSDEEKLNKLQEFFEKMQEAQRLQALNTMNPENNPEYNYNVNDEDFLNQNLRDKLPDMPRAEKEESENIEDANDAIASGEDGPAIAAKPEDKIEIPEKPKAKSDHHMGTMGHERLGDWEAIDTSNGQQPFTPKSEDEILEELKSETEISLATGMESLATANPNIISEVHFPVANMPLILDNYKKVYKQARDKQFFQNVRDKRKGFTDFLKKEENTITFMFKEFERKKAAEIDLRIKVSKTGMLDMGKLHSYKVSEDIFKKNITLPEGKDHGFIMLIDGSSSMTESLPDVVKQVITLSQFCRKAQIPFEVYTFRDVIDRDQKDRFNSATSYYSFNDNRIEYTPSPFKLRNLLSSRMNAAEYLDGLYYIWCIGTGANPEYLTGTPLYEALMVMPEICEEFQKTYNVDVLNFITLTDGDATSNTVAVHNKKSLEKIRDGIKNMKIADGKTMVGQKVYMVDDVTKNKYKVSEIDRAFTIKNNSCCSDPNDPTSVYVFVNPIGHEKAGLGVNPLSLDNSSDYYQKKKELYGALISRIKDRTNANVLGFFIVTEKGVPHNFTNLFSKQKDKDELNEKFKKNMYASIGTRYNNYDEYFVLSNKAYKISQNVDIEAGLKSMKSGGIRFENKFSELMNKKIVGKALISEFIKVISAPKNMFAS